MQRLKYYQRVLWLCGVSLSFVLKHNFGTFLIIFSHHASWFWQKSHQLLHKPLTSDTVLQGQRHRKSHTHLIFSAHFFSYCNEIHTIWSRCYFYIEHVSEGDSLHGISTVFHFKNSFVSLSVSWQEPQQWSMVKGLSRYRANINMFRRRAFWLIVRRIGEMCTQACQAIGRQMTMIWSESIGEMEKGEEIENRSKITGILSELFFFWQQTGVRHAGLLCMHSGQLSITPFYMEAQTKSDIFSIKNKIVQD